MNSVVFDCGFGIIIIGSMKDDNKTTCDRLTQSDYVNIIWTSTSVVPGKCQWFMHILKIGQGLVISYAHIKLQAKIIFDSHGQQFCLFNH